MEKSDKEALRVLAIKMYKKGISQKEISLYFGVRTNTISDWVKLYNKLSYQGLKETKRGRKKGFGKLLSAEKEKEIQKMIIDKMPDRVNKWIEEEYPKIKCQAKEENAEIHWSDETGVRNTSQYRRSYAPKGKTPV